MKSGGFCFSFFRQSSLGIGVLLFCIILIISGCDSTTSEEPELDIVAIEVTPENHMITKGGNKKFTALGVTPSGDRIPFEELDRDIWGWEWFTIDSQIATFDNTGFATGHEVGDTICWIVLFKSNGTSQGANLKKETILSTTDNYEQPHLQRINFVGRDSFGVQVATANSLINK